MLSIPARKTYYEILEVPEDASITEIKRAFKRLARKCHPDMVAASNDPEEKIRAERLMKQINNAKEVLLNPELKAEYDSNLKKLVVEVDWSSEFIVKTNESRTTYAEDDFEVHWEYAENEENIDFQNKEYKDKHKDQDLDFESIPVIRSPPIRDYKDFYSYQPTSKKAFEPDTKAIEIAPGVLFLRKCLKCGRLNLDGTPFCQGCHSGLIYDNHPFFFNQGIHGSSREGNVPITPGEKPKDSKDALDILVISRCFRCGKDNLTNSPSCMGCRANLIYYKRPLPMDRLSNLGKNKVYPSNFNTAPRQCPRCGAENEVTRKFCFSCFANLGYISPPKSEPHNGPEWRKNEVVGNNGYEDNGYKKCPNCGELNINSRDFCLRCNTRLVYFQPPITINRESSRIQDQKVIDLSSSTGIDGKLECPYCGTENPSENQVCDSCYKNLISIKRDIRYIKCPNCGCENDQQTEFCRECGHEFKNHR